MIERKIYLWQCKNITFNVLVQNSNVWTRMYVQKQIRVTVTSVFLFIFDPVYDT